MAPAVPAGLEERQVRVTGPWRAGVIGMQAMGEAAGLWRRHGR